MFSYLFSAKKATEASVPVPEKDLAAENEQLKKLVTSKDVTLSNISHEIKNPISAIIGIHEKILANKTLPSYEHKILESAKESAQSMLEMLNQILDASKIAAGKVRLEATASDLKNLLKNIGFLLYFFTK